MGGSDTRGVFLFRGGTLLVKENGADSVLERGVPRALIEKAFPSAEFCEIPSVCGRTLIKTALVPKETTLPEGWEAFSVRDALAVTTGNALVYNKENAEQLLRAFHIIQWRAGSRFCGSCGTENTDAPDELARLCPSCGRREYPRISPAVITIIINDEDKALLAHNNKFTGGVYSLIAGFTEAGESLEDTVTRETREEVGIEVKNVRYITSQPWPFPNSLMVGFTARYAGGEIRPDGVEIEDARWFGRGELPQLPGFGSVSRYLINSWIAGKFNET